MRVVTLLLASAFLAGCNSSHHGTGRKTVHVPLGTHKVFVSGELHKGDLVVCGRHRGSFDAVVPSAGMSVASSGGIRIDVKADGTAVVRCASRGSPI